MLLEDETGEVAEGGGGGEPEGGGGETGGAGAVGVGTAVESGGERRRRRGGEGGKTGGRKRAESQFSVAGRKRKVGINKLGVGEEARHVGAPPVGRKEVSRCRREDEDEETGTERTRGRPPSPSSSACSWRSADRSYRRCVLLNRSLGSAARDWAHQSGRGTPSCHAQVPPSRWRP